MDWLPSDSRLYSFQKQTTEPSIWSPREQMSRVLVNSTERANMTINSDTHGPSRLVQDHAASTGLPTRIRKNGYSIHPIIVIIIPQLHLLVLRSLNAHRSSGSPVSPSPSSSSTRLCSSFLSSIVLCPANMASIPKSYVTLRVPAVTNATQIN